MEATAVAVFRAMRTRLVAIGVSDSEQRLQRPSDIRDPFLCRAVEAIRSAAPGVPVGLSLSMTDCQAAEGGAAKVDEIRAVMEDVFLDATEGDDFVGVQTYSRQVIGPDGWLGPQPGIPVLAMGYEYWPPAVWAAAGRRSGKGWCPKPVSWASQSAGRSTLGSLHAQNGTVRLPRLNARRPRRRP